MINRKIQTLLILSALVLSTFAISGAKFPSAHATTSSCAAPQANCLYVDPATMAAAANGATVVFNVKVASIDSFNAFDISVAADVNALQGLSISAAPAGTGVPGLGGTTTVLVNCVEGSGSGCGITDGPGIVHYAVTYSASSTQGGSGTLFQVSYTAVNADPGSVLTPINAVIANAGSSLPISTASAVYGTPNPDFSATASSPVDQNGNTLQPSSEGSSVVTIQSVGGFADRIDLSLGAITPDGSGTSDFITPAAVDLASGGAAAASISVSVSSSATPGTYHQTLTLTGETTGVVHTTDVAIVIGAPGNAGLTCGSNISLVQGTSGANPVTVTSQNGLFGAVFFSTSTTGSGLSASTSPGSVSIGAGGSSGAVLFVSASSTATSGVVTLTANFGSGSSTCSFNVTVLPAGSPDYTLSSSDSSLIAIRGVQYTSTISVTNVAGFAGSVSTSVVLLPVVDNSATATVSSVSGGQATLTFNSGGSNQLLTYQAVVIAHSGSLTHYVSVTYRLEDFGVQARGAANFPEYSLDATQCNKGLMSWGSLNGFAGVITITRFRMVNINTGDLGFPTGVSFTDDNTANGGGIYTADSTHNSILGTTVTVASGSFVADPLTLCTTTDTPGGEYQLQIRGTTVVNGVKVTHSKSIFVQINSFDILPAQSYVVVNQKSSASIPITVAGTYEEDLCCFNGFGTFPFLDYVNLTASVSPDPALTATKLSFSITKVGQFTTDLINPTTPLSITVGPGGQGGLFAITVTGTAFHEPALHRSATIYVSIPSTLVGLPNGVSATASSHQVTFSGSITNFATTTQYVQIICSVVSTTPGGSVYSPQSTPVAVAAGATVTVSFTQTTTALDAGQSFNFLCHAYSSSSPDMSNALVSKDKGKGTFTAA